MSIINGRYQLQNKIGQGGMGVVYQAVDRLTGETVALKKILWVDTSSNQQVVDLKLALAHEFQLLASLRHPHIISVLDYGFDESGIPFFTMPYLAEANDFLAVGATETHVGKLHLLQQLLQALSYLHRQQIIHHDLKANNILVIPDVTSGNLVKVVDFGLSITDNIKLASSSGGTPYYLAPEIWLTDNFDSASDIFTCGLIAFQLFAKEQTHPFAPLDAFFLDRLLEEEPQWSLLPSQTNIRPFLEQLLQKEPAKRPTAVQALKQINQLLGLDVSETEEIRESYLQTAQFVGREAEREQLRRLQTKVKAGEGQAALIGGESGVGKSRLVKEVWIEALVNGFVLLRGQASLEGGLPYQVWREPLRRLCLMTQLTPLMASVLHPLIPDLPKLLGREIEPAPELNGRLAQQRLLDTIADLFHQQTRPILLLLEDLQWAEESLEVLTWLLKRLDTYPVFIIATYRLEEKPTLSAQLPAMTHIHLERLMHSDIEKLCQSILGQDNITPKLLDFLQQQSEGNTFFLVEVMRALAEETGQLDQIAQMPLPESVLPVGIDSVVQRRLALVSDKIKPLLELAAVVGRQIDQPLMNYLAQNTVMFEQAWLLPMMEAGFLSVEQDVWQFSHDKLREGLLSQLDETKQKQYHRQIAIAFEQVYPDEPSYSADLMRHWHITGEIAKAFLYAKQAGQYAQSQYTYYDALTYWQYAEQFLPDEDPLQTYEVYLAQESLYTLTGDSANRKLVLEKLQSLKPRLPVKAQGIIGKLYVDYARVIGNYEQGISYIKENIALGEQANEPHMVCVAYRQWGDLLRLIGNYTLAAKHYQTALQIAQTIHFATERASILLGLSALSSFVDHVDTERHYHAEALTVYEAVGDRFGQVRVLSSQGVYYGSIKAYEGATGVLEKALRINEEIGDRRQQAIVEHNMGSLLMRLGNFARAQQLYQRSLAICQQITLAALKSLNQTHIGFVLLMQEQFDAAYEYLEKALHHQEQIGYQPGRGLSLNFLGLFSVAQNDLTQAEKFYQQAVEVHLLSNLPQVLVGDYAALAWVKQAQGDRAEAQKLMEHVLAYLPQNPYLTRNEYYMLAFYKAWQTLVALGQTAQANEVLTLAVKTLQKVVTQLSDGDEQAQYLNQPYHGALWQARQ